ncbi:quinol:cytochrome C oxidoreductase [Aurantibacillus circumpalustris]|uniref:quinol:cytochrome C oxidoreductase n=1 Tax=Aurantibacillus circumpalustris TaxID=3036359 RepID=UPI00295BA120|nr:quinol:cytochrome C oxidoreductase [Aurantibacillus circumpalustris]
MNTEKLNFTVPSKARMFSFGLMAVGLISIILMFLTDHVDGDPDYHNTRAWSNVFSGAFFFMALSLAAAFFLGLQYAAEAGWSTTIKRVIEAVTMYLPWGLSFMMLLFLLGQFQVHHIYHWMTPGIADATSENYDKIIAGKMGYFGVFWWVRTILYMIGWLWFTFKLRNNSIEADKLDVDINNSYHWKNIKIGAWFMVLFAVTSSTASWDWVMSIDTHWFSTLFGWYIFSGMWISALTAITILVIWLKKEGYMEFVTESTIHDMGKWMFAISFLWTYLYFSQFMLIWYADIPEEVVYFTARWENYKALMWTVFFINFALPMVMLMSRDSKRNFFFLMFVGTIIFIGHYLDVIMIVMPGTVGHHWTGLSWMEFGCFFFFLGLFIYVVLNALAKVPLRVKNHPFIQESLHHSI